MTESTVAIVGSGIVGTAIAYELTRKGHDVVVFEKGPAYPYPHGSQFQEQYLYQYQNPAYYLPGDLKNHTLSGTYPDDIELERYMNVGGSATRWEGIAPRLRPNDFSTKTLYGFGSDWPITYDDLEPYYGQAEQLLGVSGTDADNPSAAPRSTPYPLPPFELSYDDLLLAERLRQQDIILHTTPQARTRQPYQDRAACANFGACVVCPIGARYSPSHHLQLAVASGLCQIKSDVSVRRIELDRAGRAKTLVYRPNLGNYDQEHSADIIIVAAGALESARLLLLSTSGRYPDGLGNQSGQVGQNLLFHHLWGAGLRYKDDLYPERVGAWTGQIDQFLDPPERGRHGGIKVEFSSRVGYFTNETIESEWRTGADVVESQQPRVHWRWSAFHAESIGGPQKFVTLSDKRDRFGDPFIHVHYTPAEFDYETYAYAKTLFDRLMQATKAEEGELWPADQFNSAAHHLGTCRMGDSLANSVVNAFGQVHNVPNLFVVGGSNFAGSGGVNPTLTMVALALRATDYMGDQVL